MNLEPVTLEGKHVRLEPLSLSHLEGLCAVGLEPELWKWVTAAITTPEQMRVYVETALEAQRQRTALPLATVDAATGAVIGST
ncbi:MAG: GNAT family N-acetyltransferase, partial [Bryobacteraceae bacterium]